MSEHRRARQRLRSGTNDAMSALREERSSNE